MLYLPADRLEAISGERDWYFTDAVRSDPRTAPVPQATLDALWHCDSELAADGLLLRVCETLRPMPGPWRPPREAAHPLGRAIDYMQACFARPITLAELAGAVNLSPYHFQRSFKAPFTSPPADVDGHPPAARQGWLAASLPAAEVAAACGLADQSHLNRAFLRRCGTTPVRYQKQVQAGR